MSTKAARGTKRTCQNEKCGKRFYDLNKDPIICPLCDTEFKITRTMDDKDARAREAEEKAAAEKAAAAKKAELVADEVEIDPDLAAVDDEDLADIEDADEVDDPASDFLPDTDEEDDDVSDIIGDNKPKVEDDG